MAKFAIARFYIVTHFFRPTAWFDKTAHAPLRFHVAGKMAACAFDTFFPLELSSKFIDEMALFFETSC